MRHDHAAAPRHPAQEHEPDADGGPRPGQDQRVDQEERQPKAPEGPQEDRPEGPAPEASPATEGFSQLSDPNRDWEAREARQAESRAHRNITGETVFTGPVTIGRDLRIQAEQRRKGPATGRVAKGDLDELRVSFAPPPDYGLAAQLLAERHLLVLRGRTGWGKSTLALHLLSSAAADGGEIRRLDPDTDLRRLGADSFEQHWAYLIDTLSHERVERLDSFHLSRLSEVLQGRGAWFVITVSDRVELPVDFPEHFKLECVDPSDEDTVLRWRLGMLEGHLRLRLESVDPERMGTALAAASAQLRTRPPPKDVVYLAKLLAPLVDSARAPDEPFDEALGKALATFEDRGMQVAERWLTEHRDAGDQAFRLALAVFNGESYQSALDAAAELEPLLDRSKGKRTTARRPLFDTRRTDRLAQAEARVGTYLEPTDVGWAPIELVELHNPTLPPAVLEFVWQEHDWVRGPLLTWLKGLGSRSPVETRARAAAAVGMLSTFGFRHVHNQVLRSWTVSDDQRERETAAWALGVPAADPELAPLVLKLVHRWAGPSSGFALKWTAAVAYGAEMGLRFPEAALQGLRRVARAEMLGLTLVVADSILNLFNAGHHDAVLDALVAWTEADQPSVRRHRGVACFLRLVAAARTDPPSEGGSWPALLVLAKEDADRRDRIVALWQRSFDLGPPSVDLALEELRRWCRSADEDERLLDLLQPLASALAERPRDRQRLVFAFRSWASSSRRPSRTAGTLLSGLDHGRPA